MSHEKMLTEIEVKLLTLEATPSLLLRPDDEFRIELFFACSRTTSKVFRLQGSTPLSYQKANWTSSSKASIITCVSRTLSEQP